MKSSLLKENVHLDRCIAFGSDNAPVMIGSKTGVLTQLQKENANIIGAPCCCHLLNLMTKKACKGLPINIDEILVDIYYYFYHSSKRTQDFITFQLLYDPVFKNILKHCPTRWLSMTICLQRLLDLWKPLKEYFANEIEVLTKTNKKPRAELAPADMVIDNDSLFPKAGSSDKSSASCDNPATSRLHRIASFLSSRQSCVSNIFLFRLTTFFISVVQST